MMGNDFGGRKKALQREYTQRRGVREESMDGQWSIKSSGGAAASSAICAGGNQPNSQSACGRCAEEGRQTMVGNMQKLVQKAFK